MEAVNSIVHGFLMLKRTIIERSDNPKGVGEVVAIQKEKDQLEEKARETYNTLSSKDKNTVDMLLENRNY